MAFINKLFSSRNRKTTTNYTNCSSNANANKCHHHACEKQFTFAVEQVQVAVFRECDFRGRKLLFDSKSVKKVQLENDTENVNETQNDTNKLQEQYVEITNGFGYLLTKPNNDLSQLREMIFGSVAMTFRGTLYKIHNLDLPPRLVFSQVFPSPRVRVSAPLNHSQQLTHSLNNSTRSSQTSYSDHSHSTATATTTASDHLSTASDTLLICKRRQHSVPLDVPVGSALQNSSLVSSSGYGSASNSSGPPSMPMDMDSTTSNSDNFENVHRSLPTSLGLSDDMRVRHRRGSKLGLAIILQLTNKQESELETFLMQHVALIETILWRVRQGVEIAYVRHQTFVSAMCELSASTASWFVDFVTCCYRTVNMWTHLNHCDIPTSINRHLLADNAITINYSSDFGFRTLTKRLFKNDKLTLVGSSAASSKCDNLEKFVKDLCDLVEHFDVKQTNFFLSTIMTAILTHHLGWVATILSNDEIKCQRSENLLVRQLCDLYGCIGFPSKLAHTIITGNNQEELINKFVNVLTYFIRCAEIKSIQCERNQNEIDIENSQADSIYRQFNHTNDNNNNDSVNSNAKKSSIPITSSSRKSLTNLNLVTDGGDNDKSFHVYATSNTCSTDDTKLLKKSRTCLGDLNNLTEDSTTCNIHSECTSETTNKVLFVLGEDEKLKLGLPPQTRNNLKTEAATGPGATPKRAQSEEPPETITSTSSQLPTDKSSTLKSAKYRYAGVKFNFQQYPQIFENYMKSKNIELSDIHMQNKKDFLSGRQDFNLDFSRFANVDSDEDDEQPLQTPSNASELEYASELVVQTPCRAKVKEVEKERRISRERKIEFVRCTLPNTVIVPENKGTQLKIIDIPMPKFKMGEPPKQLPFQFSRTLLRAANNTYLPNMALQGVVSPQNNFHSVLKRDLIISAKHPIAGEPVHVEESVAIIANIDTWNVNVISSHTYVIDKTIGGVPIGMSQLVANMLETLLRMWKLRTPPEYCLMHIEQKLREFCMQSKALAQMLLDTEFCTIELLTSALKLEVNDVPLLLAVASIHTPEVTQKYGLRFQ